MSCGRIEQVEITSGKVAKSFLRFQGSRPGLFYDLFARETCPLRCSPAPSEREPGLPPQISREKTAASHQSHSEKTSPPFFSPVSSHLFRPQILMRSPISILVFPIMHRSLEVLRGNACKEPSDLRCFRIQECFCDMTSPDPY